MNRRELFKLGVLAGGATMLGAGKKVISNAAAASPLLTPFKDPLPLPPLPRRFARFDVTDPHGDPFGEVQEMVDTNRTHFFRIVAEEALVRLHRDLPATRVWRYRDASVAKSNWPFALGPIFKRFMNESPTNLPGAPGTAVVVQMKNNLPANHIGFGVPHLTTHLHGAHGMARSDGFPDEGDGVPFDPIFSPGEAFNYAYHMRDSGFRHGQGDADDRPSTLWYHDHLLDFTGPNVYRGLAGFYLVFDELDAGDETGIAFPDTNLRLPSGAFDIPLAIQDRKLDNAGQLVYLPEDHNGFLGDRFMVNGKIQPFFRVKRRKYRFRILNGSNARFYMLFVNDAAGNPQRFDLIGTEGGLLGRPSRNRDRVMLVSAQRREIVVDFTQYPSGTRLYLENRLVQTDGRGPEGSFEEPELGDGTRLLQFIVEGDPVVDRSRVPDVLRPRTPTDPAAIANAVRRSFEFERTGGAWAINDQFIDIDRAVATPRLNVPEVWRLKNDGGGWWHPIHVHLDFMHMLTRNGKLPPEEERDGNAEVDVVNLGPNDEAEVFVNFRDFPGNWVFHCHNIEHEDAFMMARFDVLP